MHVSHGLIERVALRENTPTLPAQSGFPPALFFATRASRAIQGVTKGIGPSSIDIEREHLIQLVAPPSSRAGIEDCYRELLDVPVRNRFSRQ